MALNAWLLAYKDAWENQDARAACALFAEDAVYYVTPFGPPVCGHEELLAYWHGVVRTQQDIRFRFEIITLAGNCGYAHWSAAFTRVKSGSRIILDGIMQVTLDASDLCTEFREWWHSTKP